MSESFSKVIPVQFEENADEMANIKRLSFFFCLPVDSYTNVNKAVFCPINRHSAIKASAANFRAYHNLQALFVVWFHRKIDVHWLMLWHKKHFISSIYLRFLWNHAFIQAQFVCGLKKDSAKCWKNPHSFRNHADDWKSAKSIEQKGIVKL